MKPIKLNIDGINLIITSLEVLENGKFINISYEYDGSVNEGELNKKIEMYILTALNNSIKDIDID